MNDHIFYLISTGKAASLYFFTLCFSTAKVSVVKWCWWDAPVICHLPSITFIRNYHLMISVGMKQQNMSQTTDKVYGAQKESWAPAGSSWLHRCVVVSGRTKSRIVVLVEELCMEQRRHRWQLDDSGETQAFFQYRQLTSEAQRGRSFRNAAGCGGGWGGGGAVRHFLGRRIVARSHLNGWASFIAPIPKKKILFKMQNAEKPFSCCIHAGLFYQNYCFFRQLTISFVT